MMKDAPADKRFVPCWCRRTAQIPDPEEFPRCTFLPCHARKAREREGDGVGIFRTALGILAGWRSKGLR
jgi:hypothetical protein